MVKALVMRMELLCATWLEGKFAASDLKIVKFSDVGWFHVLSLLAEVQTAQGKTDNIVNFADCLNNASENCHQRGVWTPPMLGE